MRIGVIFGTLLGNEVEKLLLSKSINNKSDFFSGIHFEKNIENSEYMLYLKPENIKLADESSLWLDIQRDILLSIMKDFYAIVHLDKLIDKTMSLDQLDENINELYFVIQNEDGDYFIEIPPNDIRLLTEIVNDSLVWECGNLLKIAAFRDKPLFQDKNYIFEKAEVILHSFYDNLGFNIKICDMEQNELIFSNRVQNILNKYHIATGGNDV